MKRYLSLFYLLFFVIIGYYFINILYQTDYKYIYPLDDVYIHLALAKNFALHGVWSVNTYGFDSASSSINYTLLLSLLIKIFGNSEKYPLIINIILGLGSVFVYYKFFKDFYGKQEILLALLLLFPFSLLHVMVLQSMEHTMHIFIMLCLLYFIKKQEKQNFSDKNFYIILILIAINSLTRFESMFFTIPFAVILFLRKKIAKSLWVLICGFLPIIIFGMISINNGGFFFPNSIVYKGQFPINNGALHIIINYFKVAFVYNNSFWKWLFFPIMLIILNFLKDYSLNFKEIIKKETISLIIICNGFFHVFFARFEYRYENYLMISLLLVLVPIISNFFANFRNHILQFNINNIVFGFICSMIFIIGLYRFYYYNKVLLQSSGNIYRQQIQMSTFLHEFYKNKTVAANDIGAISYFSEVNLVDLIGLGSTNVVKFYDENRALPLNSLQEKEKHFFRKLLHDKNCNVIVIYKEWFENSIPENWIPVASWTGEKGYGPAINTVVFYAQNKKEAFELKTKLKKFKLDKKVNQKFLLQ